MLRLPSSSATASWPNRKFSLFISPFVLHQSAFASGFLFRSLYGFSFIVRKTSLSLYLLHSFSKTLLDLCLSIQLKCFFPSSAAFRRLFLGWRLWSEVLETLWWLRIPELTSAGWDVTFFTFFPSFHHHNSDLFLILELIFCVCFRTYLSPNPTKRLRI